MESSMTAAMPPVLTGPTDYFNWRQQLRIYVDGVNPMMWTFITEGKSTISDVADERLRISMHTSARCAVHVLLRAVSPEIATSIDENKTANDIWLFLEQRYSHGTVIQPYVLLVELVNLTQVGGVNEFVSNIERVANERALMGYPIDTATKLGCLIRGVKAHLHPYTASYKSQWEALALSHRTKPAELELALAQLFDAAAMGLRNYEASAHLKDHNDMSCTLAMAQQPYQGSQHFTQWPFQMQAQPFSRPTCRNCGRMGHTTSNCRKPSNTIGKPQRGSEGRPQGQRGRKGGKSNANTIQILAAITGAASASDEHHQGWIWDAGADAHICKDLSLMTNLQASPGSIKQAHGPPIKYKRTGNVILRLQTNRGEQEARLTNVILLEGGNFNLFSPRAAIQSSGGDIRRNKSGQQCIMVTAGQQHIQAARAIEHEGRIFLNIAASQELKPQDHQVAATQDGTMEMWRIWHKRFNHASLDRVHRLLKEAGIDVGPMPLGFSCSTCSASKFPHPPFGQGCNKTTGRLDLVVSDVQGPMQVPSLGGARYVLTITDVHTCFCWVAPIATKSAVLDAVGKWLKDTKGETGQYPKVFRSNNSGKFTSKAFIGMLAARGIERQTSSPYTPQQNGIAERLNRSLTDSVCAMLNGAGLPALLWAEAYRHACWIKNCTYIKAIKSMPFKNWCGKNARMELVRCFGTPVWVMVTNRPQRKGKLEPQAVRCIWLGIADPAGAGHRCVDLNNGCKVYILRNVCFEDEGLSAVKHAPAARSVQSSNVFLAAEHELQQLFDTTPSAGAQVSNVERCPPSAPSSPLSLPPQLPRESIATGNKQAGPSAMEEHIDIAHFTAAHFRIACTALNATSCNSIEEAGNSADKALPDDPPALNQQHALLQAHCLVAAKLTAHTKAIDTVSLAAVDPNAAAQDPTTLLQARRSPDWPKWEEAINTELASLESTGTWTIADLPQGRKPVTAKWVFKTKRDAQGAIVKHKARLVARGFTQIHGVDYHKTYSPVVSMTSLRTVLCYGLKNGYRIRQIDFVAAYLNGDLTDVNIYMLLPPGFKERYRINERSVCNLKKSLYGLKQSGREWYAKLDASLTSIGFKELANNIAVYKLGTVVMAVYVDNIIIVGDDNKVPHIIDTIKARFKITGGNDAQWCLGVHIQQQDGSIALSQGAYINSMLERFSMADAAATATPLDPSAANLDPSDPSHQPLTWAQVTTLQQIVGSIMYLMTSTRPNLAFAVSKLASSLAAPTTVHLKQARHLLRYIKLTKSAKLVYNDKMSGIPVA